MGHETLATPPFQYSAEFEKNPGVSLEFENDLRCTHKYTKLKTLISATFLAVYLICCFRK